MRRIALVFAVGEQFVPSLAAEALRVAQGASTYVLKASNANGEAAFGSATGLNHIKVGGIELPTDADGAIWLQFRPSNPAAFIPAWTVLDGSNDPAEIAGSIILVGTSAPGLNDLRATPLDASLPGVEIQAQTIEHILSGRQLTRPDYGGAIELVLVLVLGTAFASVLPRLSAVASAALGVAVGGGDLRRRLARLHGARPPVRPVLPGAGAGATGGGGDALHLSPGRTAAGAGAPAPSRTTWRPRWSTS